MLESTAMFAALSLFKLAIISPQPMLGITVLWNILYIWNLLLCLLKESATLFVEKTGHMNDNFHKPNGDPSGHKLYKGPNQPLEPWKEFWIAELPSIQIPTRRSVT
ncbi:Uncharacterized protein Fot_38536 [Forsythia ovata]|uniref:Uncharacterized protein n=1 Tax=Forsythia ovata TaxID=205694 RepID=A0ABD1S229_9LAMI